MIQIGSYKLSSVETGEFALDGGAMFGVIPKPLWSKRIGVDERNRIDMRLRALLIQGEGRNILVDTGVGNKGDAKFNDIYRVDHSRFNLESSLTKCNLTVDDVTDIVITHLHFDHAGGSTFLDENGKIKPTFPNAVYHVQKDQWNWALNAGERDRASFIRDDFVPLEEFEKINFLDGPAELSPGVSIRVSFGHTKAQQHVVVTDGKTTLFHCADMIPTSVHVGLPWIMGYDNNPLKTLEEKREIFKEAVSDDWVLFFEHCPHISAGRIDLERGVYKVVERVDV